MNLIFKRRTPRTTKGLAMKSSARFVWMPLICLPLVWVASCLIPSAPSSPGMEAVGDCVLPKSAVKAMHERADIDWPTPRCRQKAGELLSRMSLKDKIAQMVQPDRAALQRELDLASLGIGSVLAGGSSDPTGGNSARSWADMIGRIHGISLKNDHRIPVLFGVDAVHGHNNVVNAVIFPHNIGLGCTRNPALVERVGRITALELVATGADWTFAPVMAAARDERWGRTYEAFGETPELAAELGAAMIRGLQGNVLGEGDAPVLACAKHYAGDGGTRGGRDRGNTEGAPGDIAKVHLNQFRSAVAAGVGSIMASYSSVNTVKMHCHGPLLTDTLKQEMGFNGFVVSDWEAIDKLPGRRYKEQVASAINGGIDMIMAPRSYEGFIGTVAALVPDDIPEARIDDAAGRILSIKCELGMLDSGYLAPDGSRADALDRGLLAEVGSREHRAVARQAVRESLVLLKNQGGVLPLEKDLSRIHVAGKNADDLGYQCGGWTISWQGTGGDITAGTTVLDAIRNKVSPTGQGPEVTYSLDGGGAEGARVGIAVIGEKPYAEINGDRKDLRLKDEDLEVVNRLKAAGLPVVVILISGRPMILDEVLDKADALVAAWLPGTEGDGIADVLFGDYPPKGRLSHSWPRNMDQIPINVGDSDYDPLFPYGFGLIYDEAPAKKADDSSTSDPAEKKPMTDAGVI
jgi:beta-glucosidase